MPLAVDTEALAPPSVGGRPAVPAVGETCRRALHVEVRAVGDDGRRSTFTIMTGGLARDGMIVEPSGGDFAGYLRNPVVLWQHGFDFQRGNLPIGKSPAVRQIDGGWEADVDWARDAYAQDVAEKVRDGFLNAVSLGWRTLDAGWETRDGREVYVVRRWEVMEFSVVAVPADADALVTTRSDADNRQDAALGALRQELSETRRELAEVRAQVLPALVIGADGEPTPESVAAIADAIAQVAEPAMAEPPPRVHAVSPADLIAAAERRRQQAQQLALQRLGRA